MHIKTERLLLRPLDSSDASWIAQEIANPKVHQWLTAPPRPYSHADAEAFITRMRDERYCLAITRADVPCGIISILVHNDAPADLGYWLSEAHWGQGLATEAARALVDQWFSDTHDDLRSGWITGNAGSRNVLEKLDFAPDGVKQARSEFYDRELTVEKVRLTRPRWQALSATR